MKNIAKYLIVTFLIITLGACDDSLDLAPVVRPSVNNFYQNADELERAIVSVYAAFSTRNYEEGRSYMFVVPSDNSQWNALDGVANTELQDFDRFNLSSGMAGAFGGTARIESFFDAAFVAVSRANTLLTRMEDADAEEVIKNRIAAEARFIRAYVYFDLVRAYGQLPIATSEVGSSDPIPLSSSEEVYNQVIVPDLEFAVANLPLSSVIANEGQQGRISVGAAQTLLAKVYLTLGNNSGAETLLRSVISSNEYSLLANFDDLWNPANKNTNESVFELQYQAPEAGGVLADLWMPNSYGPSVWPGAAFAAASQVMVTQDLIDQFDQVNDTRFASTIRLGIDLDGNGSLEGDTENIPFQWKYRQTPFNSLNVDENTVRLRYADVLLMLAEAVGGSEGFDLIDQVRARAGLEPVDRSQSFTDALALERRLEFAFEMHRWHDLIRLYGESGAAQILQAQINGQLPSENISVTVDNLTKPIGINEAELNGW